MSTATLIKSVTELSQVSDTAESAEADSEKIRLPIYGEEPTVFTDIFAEQANIVVWQRGLCANLKESIAELLQAKPSLQTSMTVTPTALTSIGDALAALNTYHSVRILLSWWICSATCLALSAQDCA